MERASSVPRASGPALTPQRQAIPAAGGGQGALCLRGPDLWGSLGPDTRHNLLWSRPAPDKELQLLAGERDGRREPGWPSPRRGADKGARPPHLPNALPSLRPELPCALAEARDPLRVCLHVRPTDAGGGTWGSPRA